jgi:hypothetical protein
VAIKRYVDNPAEQTSSVSEFESELQVCASSLRRGMYCSLNMHQPHRTTCRLSTHTSWPRRHTHTESWLSPPTVRALAEVALAPALAKDLALALTSRDVCVCVFGRRSRASRTARSCASSALACRRRASSWTSTARAPWTTTCTLRGLS